VEIEIKRSFPGRAGGRRPGGTGRRLSSQRLPHREKGAGQEEGDKKGKKEGF